MRTSKESGLSREALMAGASAFTALTGDFKGAQKNLSTFALVANATGAEMDDIAATAAAMKDNLAIDPADFQRGFDVLVSQGKAGSIELKELATLLSGLAPSFAAFQGGKGVQGLADLGAAFQVARKGFGSAAEASTGMRALMTSFTRGSGKFKAKGVEVFKVDPKTGRKVRRAFWDIVDDIRNNKKLMGDPKLLLDAFGSDEALRVFEQLSLNRQLASEIVAKSIDSNLVAKDAATWQKSSAGQIQKAWENVKNAFAEAFTPERIERAAKAIAKLSGGIAWVVDKIELLVGETEAERFVKRDDARQTFLKRAGVADEGLRQQIFNEDTLAKYIEEGRPEAQGGRYNLAELLAIRERHAPKLSNRDEIMTLTAREMGRAFADEINRMTQAVIVQVGNDAVAKAAKNAPSQRGRLAR